MFTKEVSKTTKTVLKGLVVENGMIMDVDGTPRDLNKIVTAAFEDGEEFDFSATSKTKDTEDVEEGDVSGD